MFATVFSSIESCWALRLICKLRPAFLFGLTLVLFSYFRSPRPYRDGLQTGDVITAINGKEVRNVDDIYKALETSDELNMIIRRRKEDVVVRVRPTIVQ